MESASLQFAGEAMLLEQILDSPIAGSGESDGLKPSAQAEVASPRRPINTARPGFLVSDEFIVNTPFFFGSPLTDFWYRLQHNVTA